MSNNPTVSVLMPVYNSERYVAEAVESILAQTFVDFEFIITDDGSTDASLQILEAYANQDERIRLTSRANKGLTPTMNEMLCKAEGDFIAVLENDDVALPERLAHQVEFLQHESDVVCVSGAYELIDEKGRLLTCLSLPEHNDEIQRLALTGCGSISHPGVMMRRASLIEIGGYDETMSLAHDLDLWLRLGEIGTLANLKDAVVKYRLHKNSLSEQNGKNSAARQGKPASELGKDAALKDVSRQLRCGVLGLIASLSTTSCSSTDGGHSTAVNVRRRLSTEHEPLQLDHSQSGVGNCWLVLLLNDCRLVPANGSYANTCSCLFSKELHTV